MPQKNYKSKKSNNSLLNGISSWKSEIVVGVIAILIFGWIFNFVSLGIALQISSSIVFISILYHLYESGDGIALIQKLLILVGFIIGFILIIIPEPVTTTLGILMMAGCAVGVGWLRNDVKI